MTRPHTLTEEPRMPAPAAVERRRAEIAGSRALVADERFDALVATLIDAGLLSAGQVGVMLDRLSERLTMHARGQLESAWQVHPSELRIEAARIAQLAERCGMAR